MDWTKLLSTTRIRELMEGVPSTRSEVDPREEFDRDYGRLIFSTPVRRLKDKTQVFPLEHHDSVRTRLTHSIEVSSVARTLGREAGKWLASRNEVPPEAVTSIETITATCGLVHDIGNPPFGHAGELAIQEWFKNRLKTDEQFRESFGCPANESSQDVQDFWRFEGNAQTVRLLSRLQVLVHFYGMNLTCGCLAAACKYIPPSHKIDKSLHDHKKPGYSQSEENIIKRLRDHTTTGDATHPLTFLIEAADDIVYSTVDLEDGIKKGLLSCDQVRDHLTEATKRDPDVRDRVFAKIAAVMSGGEAGTFDETDAWSQSFRTFAIAQGVNAALTIFKLRYEQIRSGSYHDELLFDVDSAARSLFEECKHLGRTFVYNASDTVRLELMGRRVIQDLMDVFWEGVEAGGPGSSSKNDFGTRAFQLMSQNYKVVFENASKQIGSGGGASIAHQKMQLLTDQISGMTDTFACSLHKRLFNS